VRSRQGPEWWRWTENRLQIIHRALLKELADYSNNAEARALAPQGALQRPQSSMID
jgi:hypothetical protein